MKMLAEKAVRAAALLGAGLFAGAPLAAQDYPSRNVADWTVAASEDGKGCFLTRIFKGRDGSTLIFGLDTDGGNRLSLLNPNWSIAPRERMRLNFRLSNAAYPRRFVVGIAAGEKRGFVTNFDDKFPAKFAGSTYLHVTRGEVPVEKIDLTGSGAAVAELRRCVWIHKKAAAEARDIPRDPFAR